MVAMPCGIAAAMSLANDESEGAAVALTDSAELLEPDSEFMIG